MLNITLVYGCYLYYEDINTERTFDTSFTLHTPFLQASTRNWNNLY